MLATAQGLTLYRRDGVALDTGGGPLARLWVTALARRMPRAESSPPSGVLLALLELSAEVGADDRDNEPPGAGTVTVTRSGATVTAVPGGVDGQDVGYAYRWQRCADGCEDVADGRTYALTPADAQHPPQHSPRRLSRKHCLTGIGTSY